MKPAIAKLWANALRSGAYEKGDIGMRTIDGGWCSLGVLCDVMMDHIPSLARMYEWQPPAGSHPRRMPLVPAWGKDVHFVSPPMDFIVEGGFNHATPQFPGGMYIDAVNDAGMAFTRQAELVLRYMHQL